MVTLEVARIRRSGATAPEPVASRENDFNSGASGQITTFALQHDGKILVGGNFESLAGQSRSHIGRSIGPRKPTVIALLSRCAASIAQAVGL